ncbi:MAG: darcynin family protein [Acidimicrobiales bacterium]
MRYGAIVVLRLLPAWLALDRTQRRNASQPMYEIASRYRDEVAVEWFDADALGTGHTDWILCRFDELDRYHSLWEELRDLPFFSHPYAEIVQVLIGLHDGYQRYEAGTL